MIHRISEEGAYTPDTDKILDLIVQWMVREDYRRDKTNDEDGVVEICKPIYNSELKGTFRGFDY